MGYIRYQTVRNIGLGVLGAGAITGIVLATTGGSKTVDRVATSPPSAVSHSETYRSTTASSPPTTPSRATSGTSAGTNVAGVDDVTIVARADRAAAPGEKVKDAFSGNPIEVNLYEETQDARFDRLKVDRNRDDTWDEQWTRDATGPWKKEDGSVFVSGAWVSPASTTTATPTANPVAPAADAPAEPFAAQLDAVAKMMLGERAASTKLKDVFKGNGPKVNLYDDDKDGHWDRAKVDFDRDEVDDEKLTVKGGVLERKDEKSGAVRIYDAGTWRAKAP